MCSVVSEHVPVEQSDRLNVLVVGSNGWAIDAAAVALESAGHRVLRCTEPREPEFPCDALRAERGCPLDIGAGVDVVITMRAQPRSRPAPREFGVTCGIRRDVPVVVAGRTMFHPFEDWATETVDGGVAEAAEKLVRACERAAQPRHEPM